MKTPKSSITAATKSVRSQVNQMVESEQSNPVPSKANKSRFPREFTYNVHKRLNEDGLNYDPLEHAVRIAKGQAMTEDHPFLPIFLDTLATWKGNIKNGIPITEQQIENLRIKCIEYLTDSWTPHQIRAKMVTELLSLLYPKAKLTHHTHSGQIDHDIQIRPLSSEEANVIEGKFNEQF